MELMEVDNTYSAVVLPILINRGDLGQMKLSERLEANSIWEPNSGCRIWTGALVNEHGVMKVAGRKAQAHRVAWELERGPITNGLWVLHNCGVGPCINVNHLRLGTPLENRRDLNRPGGYTFFQQYGSSVPRSCVPIADTKPAKFARIPDAAISQEEVKRALDYDPATGVFHHRLRADRDRSWNMRFANEVAAPVLGNGYCYLVMGPKRRLAHRVAWLWMTGEWPAGQIDHINGDRTDNRWANLRIATQKQNSANQGLRTTNKSGVKGVCWVASKNLWKAVITLDGKNKFLGYYKTLAEAGSARQEAEVEHHGEFAKPNPDFQPVLFGHRRNAFSGCTGVSFDKKRNLWFAAITVSGKANFLGRFKTFEEAVAARKKAEATSNTVGNA